jgi:predicted RNA binding protein YcfA (HicA-like mRNA interferase family)
MSPALPSVTGREVVKALLAVGFQQVSAKGSHLKWHIQTDAARSFRCTAVATFPEVL